MTHRVAPPRDERALPGGRSAVLVAVALLVVALGVGILVRSFWGGGEPPSPPAASPFPSPGTEPDGVGLAGWKLSIPVPNAKGNPTLLQPAALVAPWMVPHSGGGVVFWAPSQGVTTENSSHARTELQSTTTFRAGANARTLRASVTVLQVPRDGKGIILGQIHGAEDISSVPYVMLRYDDEGRVRVTLKTVQEGDTQENYTLLKGVPLNSRFDFLISDLGTGEMLFAATRNGEVKQVRAQVPEEFLDATVRFQAGDYQQAEKPAGGTDGGRVIFHQLEEAAGAP